MPVSINLISAGEMFILITLLAVFSIPTISESIKTKIGIIGGGIGGTSCAYFLKELFGEDASITLFERDQIGGRLALLNVDGDLYEAGGSIIHTKNKYMRDFANMLGLKSRNPVGGRWGIYDGEKFVFKDDNLSAITLLKLFWRYGWDIFRMNSLITSLLEDFSKIYKAQDDGMAFMTVHNLLHHMNPSFPNMTQQTMHTFLKLKGFSKLFIDELAQAVMLVNYGQTNAINAFVGSVSLAGSESGLWSVLDGNKQVPIGLLERSGTKLIHADVLSTALLEDGTFKLTYSERAEETPVTQEFDVVIVAAPLMSNTGAKNVQFVNFTKDLSQYETLYHHTISTFVQGKLNNALFHMESLPEAILTNNDSVMFNSIGLSHPVSNIELKKIQKVFKIFTKIPLTQKQILTLFDEVGLVKSRDWLAYPLYHLPFEIPPFMIYPGLYYTSSIEWAASAMEMSAISGRNIALLIYNTWNNRLNLIDAAQRKYKDEL